MSTSMTNGRLIVIFSAVASLFLISMAPGWCADWHDYTSQKYHFTIKMPADVKEGKRGKCPVFVSQSDGTTYMVEVSDDEFNAGDSEEQRAKVIDKDWTKWSQTLVDNLDSVDDVTGNGWHGKVYAGTKNNLNAYGVLAFGKSHAYVVEALGPADHEDRTKLVDSLVIKDDTSDSQSGSNSSSSTSVNSSSTATSSASTSDTSSSKSGGSSSSPESSSSASDNQSSSTTRSDGWNEFESKKYYFKVLVPGSVQEMPNPRVHEFPLFKSVKNRDVYVISVETNSDHGLDGRWREYTSASPDISDVKDISGNGWSGKTFIQHINGDAVRTMMACAKDGFTYLMTVGASTDQEDKDKYFNSLITTPADSGAELHIAVENLEKDVSEKAKTPGFIVGVIVVGFFLLLIPVGIVLAVILIKRNNKQSKM